MVMVLVALAMLSTVCLTLNSMLVVKTTGMLDAEAAIDAVSYGQGVMDEVMSAQRSFDDSTVNRTVYSWSSLTPASKLGPSSSEKSSVPLPDSLTSSRQYFLSDKYYNDVGDYNGYQRYVIDPIMGKFQIRVMVTYVSETYPDSTLSTQTFAKKVQVNVYHPNMNDTLRLFDIAVYRRFF